MGPGREALLAEEKAVLGAALGFLETVRALVYACLHTHTRVRVCVWVRWGGCGCGRMLT
jgi:hypothetical protein